MANVISITNPVFATEDGSSIDCILELDALPAPVPFTASAHDVEEHGRKIYADLIAGAYGAIGAYVPPPAPVVDTPSQFVPTQTSAPVVL
jgi:hypothetical protein